MNIFYQPEINEGKHFLDEIESKHCVRVLRKKAGDPILITDGLGAFYECTILDPNPRQCTFSIQWTEKVAERSFRIHLAIAPTKNPDRIEWFVEKAVEIGVDQITFISCDHSERTLLKLGRIQKLAIAAMKQSGRASLPSIVQLTPIRTLIESADEPEKFIAYVDQENATHLSRIAIKATNSLVLIGPEGDFSQEELQHALNHDFRKVSLGSSRLRTETAGLIACHTLNLINEA